MRDIFIFGSGEEEDLLFYLPYLNRKDILIIAVDGGSNYLAKLGKTPDILIGDNDSIKEELLEKLKESNVKILSYTSEKNFSDFELASDYIINNEQKSNIILFNMFGKRIDQFLFNLEVCKKLVNSNFFVSMLSSKCEIYFLKNNSNFVINGKKGDIVSILPAKEEVNIKKTTGLKYELNNEKLCNETTRGLSNELISNTCEIAINTGLAIVIFTRK